MKAMNAGHFTLYTHGRNQRGETLDVGYDRKSRGTDARRG